MSKTKIEQYPNSMLTVARLLAEDQFKSLPIKEKTLEMNRVERELFYKNKEKYKDNVDNFLNRLIKVDGYIEELTQYLNISSNEFEDDLARKNRQAQINKDMLQRIKDIDELYPPKKGAGIKKVVGGVISDDDYVNLEGRTLKELRAMLKDRDIPVTIKKGPNKKGQYANQTESILLLREYQAKQSGKIVGKAKKEKKAKDKVTKAEKEAQDAIDKARKAEQKLERAERNQRRAEEIVQNTIQEIHTIETTIASLTDNIQTAEDDEYKALLEKQLKEAENKLRIAQIKIKDKIKKAEQVAPQEVADATAEAQQAEAEAAAQQAAAQQAAAEAQQEEIFVAEPEAPVLEFEAGSETGEGEAPGEG
jgi:hypothetical protein